MIHEKMDIMMVPFLMYIANQSAVGTGTYVVVIHRLILHDY